MKADVHIPEAEYMDDVSMGLDEIAFAIQGSGLTLADIARGTRCHWGTIKNAANRTPIRFDSYRRIMYFLKTIAQ